MEAWGAIAINFKESRANPTSCRKRGSLYSGPQGVPLLRGWGAGGEALIVEGAAAAAEDIAKSTAALLRRLGVTAAILALRRVRSLLSLEVCGPVTDRTTILLLFLCHLIGPLRSPPLHRFRREVGRLRRGIELCL